MTKLCKYLSKSEPPYSNNCYAIKIMYGDKGVRPICPFFARVSNSNTNYKESQIQLASILCNKYESCDNDIDDLKDCIVTLQNVIKVLYDKIECKE